MADILETSISGLLAAQRALATTSHNISNANTEGFSRQRAEFSARIPQPYGSGYIGTGVNVDTVRRMYDLSLEQSVRSNTVDFSRLSTFADLSGRIDNLLADKTAGLQPAMQEFFAAVHEVSVDPTSTPARDLLLTEGENLVGRLRFLDQRFGEIEKDINRQLGVQVEEINEIATGISQLNRQIVIAEGQVGQPPNDLLDKRDSLVRDLAERIGISVVPQDDGQYNVFIGNGQPLVSATAVNRIAVVANDYEPSRMEIAIASPSGAHINVTRSLTGGSVGGILDFRREVLDPVRNDMGRIATSLAVAFNEQHKLGVSLEGVRPGEPLAEAQAAPANTTQGLPTVALDPSSAGALTGDDYSLQFADASDEWVVTNLRTGLEAGRFGAAPPLGSATGTAVIDGIDFDTRALDNPVAPDPAPADGDGFVIRSTVVGADDFFQIGQPQVTQRVGSTTTGSLQVEIDPATVSELTGSDYRLAYDGAAWSLTRLSDNQSFAIPSGGTLTQDGISIDVRDLGGLDSGDSFLIRPTVRGATDIAMNISRPTQIAAASPIIAREATTPSGGPANEGNAAISGLTLHSGDNLASFDGPITLTYDGLADPKGFQVNGGGLSGFIAYTGPGGKTITGADFTATPPAALPPDISFTISGSPADADSFVIERNTSGRGDNGNMLQLGELPESTFMENGTATLQDSYSALVGSVGTSTLRANVNRDAQEVMLEQANAARDSVSGVNLEEEAANMMKFQQLYQASAQVITITNSLFQSLLQAVR